MEVYSPPLYWVIDKKNKEIKNEYYKYFIPNIPNSLTYQFHPFIIKDEYLKNKIIVRTLYINNYMRILDFDEFLNHKLLRKYKSILDEYSNFVMENYEIILAYDNNKIRYFLIVFENNIVLYNYHPNRIKNAYKYFLKNKDKDFIKSDFEISYFDFENDKLIMKNRKIKIFHNKSDENKDIDLRRFVYDLGSRLNVLSKIFRIKINLKNIEIKRLEFPEISFFKYENKYFYIDEDGFIKEMEDYDEDFNKISYERNTNRIILDFIYFNHCYKIFDENGKLISEFKEFKDLDKYIKNEIKSNIFDF